MKNLISLFIFSFLFSQFIFAAPGREIGGYPDPIPGLQAVAQFCSELEDDREIIRCVQFESAANFFSQNALAICKDQTWDSDRVNCVFSIVNKVISDAEVQLCQGETFDTDRAECLKNIQRNYPYRTFWKVTREPGASRATQFCAQFFSNSDRQQCLQVTSSAQLYSEPAIRVCDGLFSDREKLNCISQIKDKAVLSIESTACQKLFSDNDKLSCLTSVNRKWKFRP